MRSYRYRLDPTEEQAEWLAQTSGATRFVYNLALEQRRDFYRQARRNGINLNFVSQGREITKLRAECDWLREAPATPLHQALRDLDKAFQRFFRGISGFPRFRSKERCNSFRFPIQMLGLRSYSKRWGGVRVPKIGWLKYRDTRPLPTTPISATFVHDANGWSVIFICEVQPQSATGTGAVGIDRGVANTLALSTGELLSTPCTAREEARKNRQLRRLRRMARGSSRYRRQRAMVAKTMQRIASVRANWRHDAANMVVSRFDTVVLEDLAVQNMAAKARGKTGLNRSIYGQGWTKFARTVAYKLNERGGRLIKVNPAYTSQECSACGTIDKASRESQANFACRHCGFAGHADTNAAINILRRGTALMRAEGGGYVPGEARTDNHALAA